MADVSQPCVEVTLSGVLYRAAPLSDKQITELDTWVRGEYIRNARSSLSDDMSEAERDKEMDKARASAAGLSAFGGIGVAMLGTIEGVSRLAWMSLRKNHPDLTFEKFRFELFDPNNHFAATNVSEFNTKFREVNHVPSRDDSGLEKKVSHRRKVKYRK